MDLGYIAGLTSIIWLDVVLSGDNALVIGIAASTLRAELRRKAIIFGLVLATVVRIMFAAVPITADALASRPRSAHTVSW